MGGLIQYIIPSFPMFNVIKTHGSESRGQEEAALSDARASSGLRDHYSELVTRMAALKFVNAVTQPLLQYRLLNYRPSAFKFNAET